VAPPPDALAGAVRRERRVGVAATNDSMDPLDIIPRYLSESSRQGFLFFIDLWKEYGDCL
jgi:hypothetical protein